MSSYATCKTLFKIMKDMTSLARIFVTVRLPSLAALGTPVYSTIMNSSKPLPINPVAGRCEQISCSLGSSLIGERSSADSDLKHRYHGIAEVANSTKLSAGGGTGLLDHLQRKKGRLETKLASCGSLFLLRERTMFCCRP